MTRRDRAFALAGPVLVAVLCILAAPAFARAATPVAPDTDHQPVITEITGIAPVTLDAPAPPQRVAAIGAFFAYVAIGVVLASAVVLWTVPNLSSHVLLRRTGLVGRRRAPPRARS
jgi:hypothetical protein